LFDSSTCPYSFEYPVYGEIKPYRDNLSEKFWFDLVFPQYRATVYLSYKPVNNNLAAMLEDMRSLLYKHSGKADAIERKFYDNPDEGTAGFLYDIGGNAASSVQFYISDSTKHFLRGSLYFYATPNRDSLSPLIDFFREDVKHLMETVKFR
jgi:gliding motility-associated lipoprotein GldD